MSGVCGAGEAGGRGSLPEDVGWDLVGVRRAWGRGPGELVASTECCRHRERVSDLGEAAPGWPWSSRPCYITVISSVAAVCCALNPGRLTENAKWSVDSACDFKDIRPALWQGGDPGAWAVCAPVLRKPCRHWERGPLPCKVAAPGFLQGLGSETVAQARAKSLVPH